MVLGIVLIIIGVIGIFLSIAVGLWFMKKNNILFKGKYEGKELILEDNEKKNSKEYLTVGDSTVVLADTDNDTIILDQESNDTVLLDNSNKTKLL